MTTEKPLKCPKCGSEDYTQLYGEKGKPLPRYGCWSCEEEFYED